MRVMLSHSRQTTLIPGPDPEAPFFLLLATDMLVEMETNKKQLKTPGKGRRI